MKNLRLILVSFVLLAGIIATGLSRRTTVHQTACGPYRTDKVVNVGSHKVFAEIAGTPAARAKGLGGRSCIPADTGMLFVFDRPGTYAFWMKDMKFPIDMIWISSSHKAVAIKEDVKPSTYPDSFNNPNDKPAQYVLELQAYAAIKLNINPGTPVNF